MVKVKLSSRGSFGASSDFGLIAFERGLSFDPLLNLPFIPSSSIKGAVRNGYFYLCRDKRGLSEGEAEAACRLLFGDDKCAGLVGFTDAYPVEAGEKGFVLYPDVMTPHYREGVKTEFDVEPTPIVYLTVAPGTVFQFYVFWKERDKRRVNMGKGPNRDISPHPRPLIDELGLLDLAILYALGLGIGSKTSVGYSTFEVICYKPLGEVHEV